MSYKKKKYWALDFFHENKNENNLIFEKIIYYNFKKSSSEIFSFSLP
jgi:hypothetical protein